MSVTLTIGASGLRLMVVQGRVVRRWAEMPLEAGLVKDGLVVKPNAVAAAIHALFESAGVRRKRVVTSLSGLSFTHRRISLPRTKEARHRDAILREARRHIALPLEDLYVSWQMTASTRDDLEYFVVGVPRTPINMAMEALEAARIRPYVMDLRGLALARTAGRPEAVIVSLETDSFDIIIVAGGTPAILHTMAPRGEGVGLTDNLQRLTNELARTMDFYAAGHPESPLDPATPLLLTGGMSADSAVTDLLQSATGYRVEALDAPLELPPDLPMASYTTNIGLALKGTPSRGRDRGESAAYNDVDINLLTGKYGTETATAKATRVAVPVALAIAVGAAYPTVTTALDAVARTAELQAELDRANRLLREARVAADQANETETQITEINATLEGLRQRGALVARTGGPAADLETVTAALVTGCTFTSIELSDELIVLDGEAASTDIVVDYVAALEATGRYSEVRIAELTVSTPTGAGSGTATGEVSFRIVITPQRSEAPRLGE